MIGAILIGRTAFVVTGLVASYILAPEIVEPAASTTHFEQHFYVENYQIPPAPPDYSVCGERDHGPILEIAGYAHRAGFEYNDLVVATSVALSESAGDPEARARNRNGSTDSGLWQINSVHGFSGLKDPQTNADAAFEVWKVQGWSAWYAHTPRGGEYGSGPRFKYWYPTVECLLTLSPDYDTLVPDDKTGE
jgi:hypothetical protein